MLAMNSGRALGREKAAFAAVLGDQLVGPFMVAVEDRDAEPMPRRVSRQVRAHDGQSEDADVSLISHASLPSLFGQDALLACATKGKQTRIWKPFEQAGAQSARRLTGRRGNAFSAADLRSQGLSHPPPDALLVRVYYEDTDFSGRVYHASYLRFLERGRTEWLRGRVRASRAGRDLGRRLRRALAANRLSGAGADGRSLAVETSVAAARGASIEFRQRILRGDKELVTAVARVAAIRDGRPARIPADLRRLLQPRL